MTDEEIDSEELIDNLVEDLKERQEEISSCPHEEVVKVEDDLHWECSSCGVHFTTKKTGSFLPEIHEVGDLSKVVLRDYNPDWVRTEALLKRMQQLEDELYEEPGDGLDMFYKLQRELKNMRTNTDLLKSDQK